MNFSVEELRAIAAAVVDEQERRNAVAAKLPADRIGYPEREAADAMGVPWYTLRNARLKGEITAKKLGRGYVYSRRALLAWLADE